MKRYLLLLALTGLVLVSATAQNLLDPQWKFLTGDDPSWASPDLDDGDWDLVRAVPDWESQGYGTYDGYAWYRKTVLIPASLKGIAEEKGGLILRLGKIDDSDVTYLNGEWLGATGKMPPEYETGVNHFRNYPVPADRVRWGEENLIAIRVFDGGGAGGIVEGPVSLSVAGMDELLAITVLMERDDHLVFGGPARADLLVENGHDALLEGNLRIEAVSDFGRKILTETRPIRIRAGGSGKMKLDLGLLEPGFYRVSLELESTLDNRQTEFAIGVRPEEVLSPLDRPDDFEDYWMRARRELDAVAPQFRLIRQDTLCSDTREVFLLEMRSLGNILIRGWYSRPVKKGRYPAMLHVQGYNTVKGPEDLYRGDDMVSLALNIRGHGNSRDQVASPTNQPILYHLEDRETYFYRGAYMDCIRAVDFLYSREEVDTTRVAVEGGSQGGALSLATAALDKGRIDLCVPHVPFLSDFRDYFRIAAWPGGEVFQFMKEHPEIPEEEIYRALAYIDVKNLAPWVRAPVYMSVGLVDRTCPPHINFAAYNQLNVPKQYRAYPDAGHDLPGSYYAWVYEYIREQFGLTKD